MDNQYTKMTYSILQYNALNYITLRFIHHKMFTQPSFWPQLRLVGSLGLNGVLWLPLTSIDSGFITLISNFKPLRYSNNIIVYLKNYDGPYKSK